MDDDEDGKDGSAPDGPETGAGMRGVIETALAVLAMAALGGLLSVVAKVVFR